MVNINRLIPTNEDLLNHGSRLDAMGINVSSGFRCGQSNLDSKIKGLTHINGLSISTLEERMRPNRTRGIGPGIYSYDGFLGPTESLISELVYANKAVHELGITHQDIANILQFFINEYNQDHKLITHNGMEIEIEYMLSVSDGQQSPFKNDQSNDPESGTWKGMVRLLNHTTGRMISFPPQLPRWIYTYGFYEGRQSPYHLGPKEIMEFVTCQDIKYKSLDQLVKEKAACFEKQGLHLSGYEIKQIPTPNSGRLPCGDYTFMASGANCSIQYHEFISKFWRHGKGASIQDQHGKNWKIYEIGSYSFCRTKGGLTVICTSLEGKRELVKLEIFDKPNPHGWTSHGITQKVYSIEEYGDVVMHRGFYMDMQSNDTLENYSSDNVSVSILNRPGQGVVSLYIFTEDKKQQILLTNTEGIQKLIGRSDFAFNTIEEINNIRIDGAKISGNIICGTKKIKFSFSL